MLSQTIELAPEDIVESKERLKHDPDFICAVEPGVNSGDWIITGPDGERSIVHSEEERDETIKRMIREKRQAV